MRPPMRRLVLLAALAALPGCFYPANRGKALETKVDKLGTDNAQLNRELKRDQGEAGSDRAPIDEKVGEVTKAMESLDKAARRSEADIGIQFQKTVEDLAQLRGQVETYLFKIGELRGRAEEAGRGHRAGASPSCRAPRR